MRGPPKTLLVALVALLLALGASACGGDDESSSTATGADQGQADSQGSGSGSGGESEEGGSQADDSGDGGGADGFTPKEHDDSGGGSEQFKVKGADNSVQEFGSEADSADFDAAAAVLHNYLDARAEGNWATACEYLSQTVVESIESFAARDKTVDDSCAAMLGTIVDPAALAEIEAEAKEADVRSLRTDGERGFLLYTDSDGKVFSMPMENEDGEWRVAGIAAYPLSELL